ncbi:MAG: 50S ribosomal protein L5 [Planctomycetota bacterium]|jgi:large subunit ribosomal protein L5
MPRLQARYRDEIRPKLMQEFGYGNRLAVPQLERITLNMGIGKARENAKLLEDAMRDLATITGQRPIVTRARKSIAQFHIRDGYPVGCCVTLRGRRMYEFLDRLISLAIPRIRDFRGLRDKFDGRGNYSMGLADQVVFPEVDPDKVDLIQGMNITMRITGGRDDVSRRLLEELGLPFRRREEGR